ncbi:response regulator transcription factor [Rhizobium sp. VS19-DR104.2]|uniref:response regulator transcription factor n=1 Tax=unclassified Rhizobium TaxID=2613769 RepID=UPI001CC7336E|nr:MULTISPECIES: response regulator transcription factor [unclassified Rhizobium]MBZ5762940.1 response regulator transcription factor [Rhizobium sp. VS19-DR96]MBZ5768773.1 response regulator transcription factor [Rhizobium sp. VS19-DR129.2]MBZ5776389.1 response regulator transcription factor [Rhizobium sp. VS19-DRK62.2]MBZ5787596.1 response regulator transcription factor [Rhizobium sp. VS19-DR121]MBZ5804951.1 response regulator transcription factor [Rhizobium sp. VS19-DR181]
MRVMLVEDEPEMASALRDALARSGMILDHASNLADAEIMAEPGLHDVLILDRQLPDGEGLSLVPKLRAKGNLVPVLVLTARGEIADRVEGLDHGADDYLAKPFAFEELLARLRALLRRPATVQTDIVTIGRLTYDHVNRDARVGDVAIDLTRRELLVLDALLRRLGRMVPRSLLMEAVFTMDDEVQPNALDTQVSRLRRKLADADSGIIVNGVRGVGYLLREEP